MSAAASSATDSGHSTGVSSASHVLGAGRSASAQDHQARLQPILLAACTPVGLEPIIFGLEVRRLVHSAKGALVMLHRCVAFVSANAGQRSPRSCTAVRRSLVLARGTSCFGREGL